MLCKPEKTASRGGNCSKLVLSALPWQILRYGGQCLERVEVDNEAMSLPGGILGISSDSMVNRDIEIFLDHQYGGHFLAIFSSCFSAGK